MAKRNLLGVVRGEGPSRRFEIVGIAPRVTGMHGLEHVSLLGAVSTEMARLTTTNTVAFRLHGEMILHVVQRLDRLTPELWGWPRRAEYLLAKVLDCLHRLVEFFFGSRTDLAGFPYHSEQITLLLL